MTLTVTKKIVVNGKEYHSIDELPPDVRAVYDKAMASPDKHVTVRRITVNGADYEKASKTTIMIIVLAVLAAVAFAVYRGL